MYEHSSRADEWISIAMERYLDMVYRLAHARTGSRQDAEDISQEVFLKAWRGINGFRGECSFATWLRRIAKNAACDFLRKEQKRKDAMLAELATGDTVLTTSGFYGTVIDITDDTVIVEFGSNKNCRIPMQKAAIAAVEKADQA